MSYDNRKFKNTDEQWSVYNKERIEHFKNMDFGLYRNTTFLMAEILRKEEKYADAINLYFEVCCFDINGANNRKSMKNYPEMLKDHPSFTPSSGFLAPKIIYWIKRILYKNNINLDNHKEKFIQILKRYEKLFPISLADTYMSIISKINE